MPSRPPPHRPPGWKPRQCQAAYDKRRGPDRQFYGSPAWRLFRKGFLARHPLCADCQDGGLLTPANEVHHEQKRKDAPEATFDEDACRALCKGCHSRRTRAGE